MISYLQGCIFELSPGKLTLTTGTPPSLVGYQVQFPPCQKAQELTLGQTLSLFIITLVRQDSLDLFGFFTSPQKQMFTTLTSVTGIGPKSALQMLTLEPEHLIQFIMQGQEGALSKVPGCGKKTAARLITELKPTFEKQFPLWLNQATNSLTRPDFSFALDALIGLGYDQRIASQALQKVLQKFDESKDIAINSSQLVKQSLKLLSQPDFAQ
jgi:Holliday junction DNA helicase RuvA